MSNEILTVLEYMEKEKGIPRDEMISAIVNAIKGAAAKGVNSGQELRVEVNPRNGQLKAWQIFRVVDSVSDPKQEIHVAKAIEQKADVRVGDVLEREMDPSVLGRIAAQTARQTIMQRVRQFEKDRIYDEYKDSVGDIVTGTVRRRERGDLIVDLGKAEAMLPARERVPGEEYAPGERIRCLLLAIESTNRGPELVLSRASVRFVRRLFELEVAEIADGTVVIEAISREPGYRSKIAVRSLDEKVDPVGACVGARGARVKSIVRELGGEKIDICKWSANPLEMLAEAIKPAKPLNVQVDQANKRIFFEVVEADLKIAIGQRGQNARLTSKLMGWRLDISKVRGSGDSMEERVENVVDNLARHLRLSTEEARFLVNQGLNGLEAFEEVTVEDLTEMGFQAHRARQILEAARDERAQHGI